MRGALWGCLCLLIAFITACGTSDSSLRDSGHNESYIQGFHDGRHSGLQEAGNEFEHYIRDETRFNTDADYKAGWLAGEGEGKKLQAQATSVGGSVGNAMSSQSSKPTDPEKVAKEVLEHTDTSQLKNLK